MCVLLLILITSHLLPADGNELKHHLSFLSLNASCPVFVQTHIPHHTARLLLTFDGIFSHLTNLTDSWINNNSNLMKVCACER